MSKKTVLWIIVIVVVLAGAWLLFKNYWSIDRETEVSPSPASYATPTPKTSQPKNVNPAGTTESSMTYSETLNTYSDRRIQFDEFCHGRPGQMVLKKGTKIMLDNRSDLQLILKMDKDSYVMPAYGWRIVTLPVSAAKLPYDLGIDCSSSRSATENGAVINIQATIYNQ